MTLIGQNPYLNTLEDLFTTIQSEAGSNKSGSGSSIDIGNILNGSTAAISGITSDNHNQKVNGIQTLIDTAMSLLSKLGASEAAKAKAEATKDKKAAAEFTKAGEEARAELEKNINEQSYFIEDQSSLVKESIGELGKANEQIQEKQEEINKIIQQINELQAQLAGKTPEEQAQILGQIQTLSGKLASKAATISDVQKTVESASSQVENAVTNIETAKGHIVEIQENGQMVIQEQMQKGVQELQKGFQRQVQGQVNEATGTAAEKAAQATATSTFGIGAGAAAKLYKVSFDQDMAGSTRKTSSAPNLQTVLAGIGKLGENVALLTQFETAIGGAMKDFNGYVGDWNTALEPVITSIGSFTGEEGVIATNEQLQEAVTVDLNTLGATVDENGNVENKNTGNNENEDTQNNEQLVKPELFTPNVKFKEFEVEKK